MQISNTGKEREQHYRHFRNDSITPNSTSLFFYYLFYKKITTKKTLKRANQTIIKP